MTTWLTKEISDKVNELSRNMPFQIHGDINMASKEAYPTHTHGLVTVDLPDIFINASAFGPVDNAKMINIVASGLILDKNHYAEFLEKSILELKTGVYEDDIIMCLRKVENNFLGVTRAYNNDEPSIFGYAQLYVQGDSHVLVDDFYKDIP